MFYFTDKVTDENRDEIKKMLEDSIAKVEAANIKGAIRSKIVYNNVAGMPDFGVYGEFESFEALAEYQVHPEHVKYKNAAAPYSRDRVVFDWED